MSLIRLLFFGIFLAGTYLSLSAQKDDLAFVDFLVQKGSYREAIFVLNKMPHESFSQTRLDSLNYFKGWAYYSVKELDSSSVCLGLVSQGAVMYSKSSLFSAYNRMHLGQLGKAKEQLSFYNPSSHQDSLMKMYLTCGMELLSRNYKGYHQHRQQLDCGFYGYVDELTKIDAIASRLQVHRPKSVFCAGLMSALVPGSGKIYLGRTGQGISSMLLVTGLGLVTAENIRKRGMESFASIFFGTVFTTFYVGNILGTVKLGAIVNQEFNAENDAKILFNLHIPLRNLYN